VEIEANLLSALAHGKANRSEEAAAFRTKGLVLYHSGNWSKVPTEQTWFGRLNIDLFLTECDDFFAAR
jgi:hypothetical protein